MGTPGVGTVLWEAGEFDTKGRALSQTLAQGITTSATYKADTDHVATLTAKLTTDLTKSIQNKTYGWDTLGNLTSREDLVAKRRETFGYDNLNRLTSATANATESTPAGGTTVPPPAAFVYDTKGNLTSKPGASLNYPTDLNAIRPHAVSSATIKGAARTYLYDAAGYVENDGKRAYTWTSFGQLLTLNYAAAPALKDFQGTMIHAAGKVETKFAFDAAGNRSHQLKERTDTDGSSKLEKTTYLGSYERELHETKTSATATPDTDRIVHRHSIGGFAVYTRTESAIAGTVVKLTTLLKDHLGSTDLLYTSTWNGSAFANPVKEFQSFDPWGERRSPDTLVSYRATDTDPFRTSGQDYDRGYTGHEQLDDSGLIHMNGRLYDPELGRMLSPDPFVQVPEYSQNFNRYSYVMNNPLNLTDPTGFSWLGDAFHDVGGWLKENWRTLVVIVVVAVLTLTPGGQALIGPAASSLSAATGLSATAATGAVVGSIAGGLSSALAGGSIGDILRGALIGGIQGGISGGILHGMEGAAEASGSLWDKAAHIVGHGVLGGASNVAMGGKFQDGFLSAAASAYAGWTFLKNATIAQTIGSSGYGRTAIAGIVGGTASALGGGKFANGAWTAAFQHLLNAELKNMPKGVVAFFDKSSSTLSVTDWGSLDGGEIKADTGGEYDSQGKFIKDGKSALPDGTYYIVDDPKGRTNWFGLYSASDGYVDDLWTPNGSVAPQRWLQSRGLPSFGLRGQFRLHLGERSLGCVTCWVNGSPKEYNKIASMIQNTKSYQVPISAGSMKTIKVYGKMYVY